jgi:hypothetical protein
LDFVIGLQLPRLFFMYSNPSYQFTLTIAMNLNVQLAHARQLAIALALRRPGSPSSFAAVRSFDSCPGGVRSSDVRHG